MNKLLIVKLSSFGDVLHALPVVQSIKKDLPQVSIGWVVRERCAGLLLGNRFIDRVFVVKNKPAFRDLLRLRTELASEGYDTAFDMQGLFLSGIVTAISGAKRRVGLNRNRELNGLFLTEASVEGRAPRHAIDILLGFRRAAGLGPVDRLEPVEHLGATASHFPTPRRPEQNLGNIVLNVGASTIYKRWPVGRWIQLANEFTSMGYGITLTSGPMEIDDANAIESGVADRSRIVNLGGKTSQSELASVFRSSELVVSGDTGPMHLADAVGLPTLALFGPTDPKLTGPYGANSRVIWKQLPCSPCFRHPTCNGRVDCLSAITAEEVLVASAGMLKKRTLSGLSNEH